MIDPLNIAEVVSGRGSKEFGYSYKLAVNDQYGIATEFVSAPTIDEKKMSVRFPFASGQRRDGVGDLLEIGGIRLDRHRKNPVILYDHAKTVSLPIAKAINPDTGEYTVELDPESQTAWVTAYFYNGKDLHGTDLGKTYDHALFCEQLFDLIAKGFVRAGSIGYQVIKGLHLPAEPERGTPPGLHLISVLMLEASAVVMPANQDTVMKALALPYVCGKPMSPVLFKSLSAYAPEKKAQLGYEGKSDVSPEKAREILHDGEAHGHPLTEKQRRFFGAQADKATDSTEETVDMEYESKGAYEDGYRARLASKDAGTNPHKEGDAKRGEWHKGWEAADKVVNERKQQKALRKKYLVKRNVGDMANDVQGDSLIRRLASALVASPKDQSIQGGLRDRITELSGESIPNGYMGYVVAALMQRARNEGWKDLEAGKKSLDLRKKYRPVKNLRRKLKSGSPGAAIVHIGEKDMVEAKQFAISRGIKFAHLGTGETGLARVKLIGDDGGIDEFAKHYGRRLKSTSIQETKTMSDKKTKALTNTKKKSAADTPTDSTTEKWGAQMMRRAHEDHGILLKDYDEMKNVLEDEEISKHFDSHMANMAKFLDDTEKLWDKKYKDHGYEPLVKDLTEDEAEDVADELVEEAEDTEEDDSEEDSEGEVEDKDADTMEDNAVPATDSEEEVPTPEEAVEGMSKGLSKKEIKTLKKKYGKASSKFNIGDRVIVNDGGSRTEGKVENYAEGSRGFLYVVTLTSGGSINVMEDKLQRKSLGKKKSVCAECGKEDCKCGTKSLRVGSEVMVRGKVGYLSEWIPSTGLGVVDFEDGTSSRVRREEIQDSNMSSPRSMGGKNLKKDLTEEELQNVEQDLENQTEDTEPNEFQEHESKSIGEAAGFLREKSAPDSMFGEEDRFKSYHYHKTLEGIGQVEDMAADTGMKAAPGSPEWAQEEMTEPEHKSHRKACGEASQFFKALACTKDFGDKHRQGAAHYADVLEGVVGKKAENTMNPDVGTHQGPGDVAGKELEETVRRNGDRINALLKVMSIR